MDPSNNLIGSKKYLNFCPIAKFIMETQTVAPTNIAKKQGLEVSEKKTIHKIRITLMAKDVKSLEKGKFLILIF